MRVVTVFFATAAIVSVSFFPAPSRAKDPRPNVANYYLRTPIRDAEVSALAKYGLLVLGMQAQEDSAAQIKAIRAANPSVKILAYVASQEVPYGRIDEIEKPGGLWHRLVAGIDPSWWLKDGNGSFVSTWPGNRSLDVTDGAPLANGIRWNDYLPAFMKKEVYATGLWDGIFYDNLFDNAHWYNGGAVDADNDGKRDDARSLDAAWAAGMEKMINRTREGIGPRALLMGNGGQSYASIINGRLFEGFGFAWDGGWAGALNKYLEAVRQGQRPQTTIVNFNTGNTGNYADYKLARFGLGTALLGDGYYAFDHGTEDHSQTLWFDEYDVAFGKPVGPPRLASDGQRLVSARADAYRRDFERAVVFVNGSDFTKTLRFGGELEALRGTQDPSANDGRVSSSFELPGRSAKVFLRPLERVQDVRYVAGSYVRVFSADGTKKRNGFFTANEFAQGGTDLVELSNPLGGTVAAMVEGNGIRLTRADGSFDTAYPFGKSYAKGMRIAVADIAGDGYRSLVAVGQATARQTPVVVLNFRGQVTKRISVSFDALAGVPSVAVVPPAGKNPALLALAPSKGPVRIFDFSGKARGTVAAGDNVAIAGTARDGAQAIAALPRNAGTGTEVRLFDVAGKRRGTVGFGGADINASDVAYRDVDADGTDELLLFSISF